LRKGSLRFGEHALGKRDDTTDVIAGGELGNDAAVRLVHFRLRMKRVREQAALGVVNRKPGLVARGLDAEGKHALGPASAMGAYANGCPGAPIKAQDEAKTSGLGEDGNTEWRPRTPVPFGLLPKTPIAALQSLAGRPARLRLCALR